MNNSCSTPATCLFVPFYGIGEVLVSMFHGSVADLLEE